MLTRPRFLLFGLLLPALLPAVAAQTPASPFARPHVLPEDRSKGAAAVDINQCKEWLYTLASPDYGGRQTGQPGFQMAAEYVSAHFRALGLEARGENGSYYQTVPWTVSRLQRQDSFVQLLRDGEEVLQLPSERFAGSISATVAAEGEVVLLLIAAQEIPAGTRRMQLPALPGLDAIDVAGKVVITYIQQGDRNNQSVALTRMALQQGLSGKQAAAVLMLQDAPTNGVIRERSGAGRRAGNPALAGARRQPSELSFGGDDLNSFLDAAALPPETLQSDSMLVPTGLTAKVQFRIQEEQAPAMNVWAVLPGSDPELRDEYVVIGSHLDHVGYQGGVLHPGADDDASGTTGVMAVAQMFVKNDLKPRRSILFVCFAGEEDGLIGSDYFARNSPVPLSAMVAELQMDMIGRDEEENVEGNRGEKAEDNRTSLHLVGTQKLSPALHELCLQKNEAALFEIEYDQEGMFSRSDHANFAKFGVPIAFFFTGLHRDYHRPTDTPDKIHYEKLLRVAHYVYDIAFELAQQDGRPEIDPELWRRYRSKAKPEPAAPLLERGDK